MTFVNVCSGFSHARRVTRAGSAACTQGTNLAATLRRGLRVTEPTGARQFFIYCNQGPDGTRYSYHWDRAGYDAISDEGKANLLDMPDSDFLKAEARRWLHWQDLLTLSDTVDVIIKPKPSESEAAPSVGFTYQGQEGHNPEVIGTLKRVMVVDSSFGRTEIERNSLGRPTKFTFDHEDGTVGTFENVYDANGTRLRKVSGPRGELVRGYGYHADITNLLMSVTNAYDEVIRYEYDTNVMKVTRIAMPSGLVRSNFYYVVGPNKGFLAIQMDVGSRINSFGYENGNLTAQTDELGLVTTHTYDSLNRLTSTAYPDGTTTSNVYDKLDLAAVKDRLNQWTYYGYNAVRQLVAVTNVNGQVTEYAYCGCGSPSQITRWNGTNQLITSIYYDSAGRLTNIVYPDNYQLNYTYHPNFDNLVKTVTDSSGYQLDLNYLKHGEAYKLVGAILGGKTLLWLQYDEYGRVTNRVDRNGVATGMEYDFLNRLVSRQSYAYDGTQTRVESFVYDGRGLTNYTDALGQLTTFVRDAAGRVLFETNANHEVLRFTYDAADNLTTLTDGKNQTTTWVYDAYGRVTSKTNAANSVVLRYQYDPLDRLTNRWSAAKTNTIYKYDAIGNLTNVIYPTSSNIVFRYDDLNRLTNMVDGSGSTAFEWTDGDQLAGEDGPWASDKVSFTYQGRLRSGLSVLQPNASAWIQGYGYDEYVRLTNVTSPAGLFKYVYRQIGSFASDRATEVHFPGFDWSSLGIVNEYDGLARLTNSTLYKGSPALNSHTYWYDAGSQRTQQVFTAGNRMDYTYDNIGQLKTAQGYEFNDTARLHEQFGYEYDAAWNLKYRTNNALVQTFNVNNLNELTGATREGTLTVAGHATLPGASLEGVTVSGTGLSSGAAEVYEDGSWARASAVPDDGQNTYTATATELDEPYYGHYGRQDSATINVSLPSTINFLYDLNGNLRTNNTRIYDYDDENQLIRVIEPNVWKSEFTYDGLMRRRARFECTWNGSTWVTNAIVRYVYDGMLVVQERDGNNLPQVTYTRGNDLSGSLQGAGGIGGLLARTENPKLLTQNSQTAHAFYHCDGNGNVTCLVNSNGAIQAKYQYDPYGNLLSLSGPLAEANTYRFSSKEWHQNSGLVYYGFRYYSPSLQRWVNQDPVGEWGDFNLFRHAANNPVSHWDSQGQCGPCVVVFVAAVATYVVVKAAIAIWDFFHTTREAVNNPNQILEDKDGFPQSVDQAASPGFRASFGQFRQGINDAAADVPGSMFSGPAGIPEGVPEATAEVMNEVQAYLNRWPQVPNPKNPENPPCKSK